MIRADRLIQSIQVGKEYLNDVTNLASSIDIQSLEKIVEAASTLRQRSQRNIALYDIAMKIFRLRQAVKQGNWVSIRGLLSEIDSTHIVSEVAEEILKLKQLAQENQHMHDELIAAMSSNQVKGTQIKLNISNCDVVNLLRALSLTRFHNAPILSSYDKLMVNSAEILTTLRTCIIMEDYDRLKSEINRIDFNYLSSYCIQEILLIKSSIDLWTNLQAIHECLKYGGITGDVGSLNVRCPSLYPLTTALMSISSVQYPESTKLFLENAKFIERLRQAVKGGKWNIEQVSQLLCHQLSMIYELQDSYKAKLDRLKGNNATNNGSIAGNTMASDNQGISKNKLPTTHGRSYSITTSNDTRYFLCRIEDTNYCNELFGGQLISKFQGSVLNNHGMMEMNHDSLKNRRYNKEVEYKMKKLLTNVSLSMKESLLDKDYWAMFRLVEQSIRVYHHTHRSCEHHMTLMISGHVSYDILRIIGGTYRG